VFQVPDEQIYPDKNQFMSTALHAAIHAWTFLEAECVELCIFARKGDTLAMSVLHCMIIELTFENFYFSDC